MYYEAPVRLLDKIHPLSYRHRMKSWSWDIKETLRLGVPMACSQLSQTLMSTTDVALAGRLQGDALAALAVGHAAYGMLVSLGIGVVAAVSPLVSQAHGASNQKAMARAVSVGVYSSLLLGLFFCPLLYSVHHLFAWLHYNPEMSALATGYSRGIAVGLPFVMLFFVQKNYLESISQPRLPMMVAAAGLVLNGFADYALMYGRFGFPAMGVTGTGLATSVVYAFMALALLPVTWKPEFTQAMRTQSIKVWKEFWEVGLPIAGSIGVEVGLFVVGALMMGRLGPNEAGAHQIVLVCAATTFMVPLGVSFAGTTRVGQAVGRGDFQAVRPAGLAAMAVGCGFMAFTATLFLLTPSTFVELFWDPGVTHNETVKKFAMELLKIAGFFQILDGLQVTATGALRGIKDVKYPLVIAGISYWIVGLSAATYLTFYTPLRHRGLWFGFLLGLGTAGVALSSRFWKLSTRLRVDTGLQRMVSMEDLEESH